MLNFQNKVPSESNSQLSSFSTAAVTSCQLLRCKQVSLIIFNMNSVQMLNEHQIKNFCHQHQRPYQSPSAGPPSGHEEQRSARPQEAAQSQGPPEAAKSQGPPEAAQSQGPPEAAKSQGPPEAAKSQGPSEAAQSQGPPEAAQSQGPSEAAQSQGPPETARRQRPPEAAPRRESMTPSATWAASGQESMGVAPWQEP
uniref:Uncharacterized protein n=1 Tax=Seriola lalandi dorsalis TaxID=1841481 RepID=A0A3B4X516_SERLL